MVKIEMVVLDMAGTTVNEDNLVYKTVQKVINDEGYPVSIEQVLEFGAGKEKHKAISDVLAATTGDADIKTVADRAFTKFKAALEKAYDEADISSFNGIELMFKELRAKNIKIALNTGYDRNTATKLLAKLSWIEGVQYDALITADDVENGRPHPDMILKAMACFDIKNVASVLKAGDSEIDILEGKNAGCGLTVGVLSGAQNRQQLELAAPDFILNDVTELAGILDLREDKSCSENQLYGTKK